MAAGPEHLGSGGGSGFLGSFVVRDAAEHIPTSIVRPAQIVGDAETGFVATFNTLYDPLKLYLKGQLPMIPVSASQKLNMVPVDYVSRIVVRALLDSNKAWRMPHGDIMSIMIKMADASIGSYDGRHLDKPLVDSDWETIARAVDQCYDVLEAVGVPREKAFFGTLNAGHPGGCFPLTKAEAETLHHDVLPVNLYVADASLLPRSIGNPPILTTMALAKRVARLAAHSVG